MDGALNSPLVATRETRDEQRDFRIVVGTVDDSLVVTTETRDEKRDFCLLIVL